MNTGISEQKPVNILVVEDEEDLANILQIHLAGSGYLPHVAQNGAEAVESLQNGNFELVLLDVMLPDINGTELCLKVRAITDCPIIFMSCLDDNDTIVKALANGGDDYVVKPVNYDQLLARIAANLRRTSAEKESSAQCKNIKLNSFRIDFNTHKATGPQGVIDLTATEFALFACLAKQPETLVLYDELYSAVWGSDSLGDTSCIMVHMSNLRKKLEKDIIATVRGAGYILSDI